MVYQVTGIKTLNTQIRSLFGKVQIGLQYLLNRSGPMSMAPSQLGAFAFSSAHYQLPNLQYHVQPLSLDKFGEDLHSFNAFTASVCNLQPSSRGSVHIVSADTHTPPRIDPNYLATAEDQQVALDAMRLTRKIVSQPSLKPTLQPYIFPTSSPSILPSNYPTIQPSIQPKVRPSRQPTIQPTNQPTVQPSCHPSR
jgi:choline dehydrogenase